jgi:RHS repeat-associated protein
MAELDEIGNPTDFYLFPPDGLWSTDPILRKSGSSHYYYQTDHLGTPQQLIDATGAIVHSREMRAFGETRQTGIEDRWGFPGQVESAEPGLYYNYFRDYEPQTGRYVQSDPIGLIGDLNIYLYGKANANLHSDPLGLLPAEDDLPWVPDEPEPGPTWPGPGKCETESDCWNKARKNLAKCNKHLFRGGAARMMLCHEYWKWYQTQCPGKVPDPSCDQENEEQLACR